MTAEIDHNSPKFDEDGAYSRDEFIYRIELLLLTMTADDPLAKVLRDSIEWAQKHDESAVIRWMEAPNGDAVPYVEICVPVTDDEFGLDKPSSDLIN